MSSPTCCGSWGWSLRRPQLPSSPSAAPITVTIMPVTELLRLMTLLSPAFPTGAFSYSHGLEWAVHAELVQNRADLAHWLSDLLERGSLWNDAVLLAAAWRGEAVEDLA